MARAVDGWVRGSSAESFASGLVVQFKERTIVRFLDLVREVAVQRGKIIRDMEVRLTFVKSEYMIEGYIMTSRAVGFEGGVISESVSYGEKLHRVFATNSFAFSGEKK